MSKKERESFLRNEEEGGMGVMMTQAELIEEDELNVT
jgi:hypothetical protein